MIYLYISSEKPDNLGKTVVKIMFKFTNARAQGFSPRNVCVTKSLFLQVGLHRKVPAINSLGRNDFE